MAAGNFKHYVNELVLNSLESCSSNIDWTKIQSAFLINRNRKISGVRIVICRNIKVKNALVSKNRKIRGVRMQNSL